MVSYNLLILCVVLNVLVEFTESIPTFNEEFVHIKVHVPNNPSSDRGILKPKQESGSSHHHHHHHVGPKVKHHFHRRRRPIKKLPKIEAEPLLENLLLAELDNPNNEQSYHREVNTNIQPPIHETYVIKAEHNDKPALAKVNTYTVVEETLNKPNYKNHYKETYLPPHREYETGNIKTFKIIKEYNTQPKQYQPKHVEQHVETIKLLEEKPYYPYKKHVAKEDHYVATQAAAEEEEEEDQGEENYYSQQHLGQDDNEYYKFQQQEPLGRPYQELSFKNYHGQEYFQKPLQETIEIIKTKKPENYHYQTENDYNYHRPQEENILQIKETQYSKPKDAYYRYTETPEPETGYHYHIPSTTTQHRSSYETHAQDYTPSAPAVRIPQFEPALSYIQNEAGPHINSNKYSYDVQQQLPSTDNPSNFQSSYNFQTLIPTAITQSTIYDELGTSSVFRPGTAEETYTGHDSYSAAHVQGLGSGGYQFPLAYS